MNAYNVIPAKFDAEGTVVRRPLIYPSDTKGWTAEAKLKNFGSGRGAGTSPAESVFQIRTDQKATAVQIDVTEAIRRSCARFDPLFRRLESISAAAATWNRTSMPPNAQAIDDARALLARIQASGLVPDGIVPSCEGGIGIFFRRREKYADFECLNSGEITAITSDGRGTVKAFPVDSSFEGENRALAAIRDFLRS